MSSVQVLSRLNFGEGTQKVGTGQRSVGCCFLDFSCRMAACLLSTALWGWNLQWRSFKKVAAMLFRALLVLGFSLPRFSSFACFWGSLFLRFLVAGCVSAEGF